MLTFSFHIAQLEQMPGKACSHGGLKHTQKQSGDGET